MDQENNQQNNSFANPKPESTSQSTETSISENVPTQQPANNITPNPQLVISPQVVSPSTNNESPITTPVITATPAKTPVINTNPPSSEVHPENSPGIIVLQWLTYAFWGWTVLSMSILTTMVMASLINGAQTGDFIPYGVAAVLVLLPIAVACDVFYSKREPLKKTGAASIVMVLHAVLFAIFGIGSLIWAVISLIFIFTNSSDSSGAQSSLYSALIVSVLYAALFVRTLNFPRFPWIRRFFPIFMVIVVGIITVLGIVGPVANARLTRNDRLIEDNLSTVQNAINDYADQNFALPNDLSDVKLYGDSKKLETSDLVVYKPNSKAKTTIYTNSSYLNNNIGVQSTTTLYYELCVNYKKASDQSYQNYSDNLADSSGYSTTIYSYSHPAGETCYKLKTTPYKY